MQNLYNVESSADGLSYTFVTRYNIRYQLALISYPLGEINAFCLTLYPETEVFPVRVDLWIKNTVVKTIGDILNRDSSVVFYICDTDGNKQDQRHNVFSYWYKKSSEHFYYISKFDYSIESEQGYKLNATLLYNNENPLGGVIVDNFIDTINNDNQ